MALRLLSCTALKASRTVSVPSRRLAVRTMASAAAPSYHVLTYKYVPDILEKRDPYRAAHLDGARAKATEGKIVLAGALQEPVDGAIFIWKDASKEEIEAFVKADPYVLNDLVPEWSIRPYMVVAGSAM